MKHKNTILFVISATFLASVQAKAQEWRPLIQCEGNAVRLDVRETQPYRNEYQLVISSSLAEFRKLQREGGINDARINSRGEFVLSQVRERHGHFVYIGTDIRDQGQLVYKIVPTGQKLALTVGWTDGDPMQLAQAFTGASFYLCTEY